MGSEWRDCLIGDIAEVIGGSTPSTKVSANFDGEIPWLTPKDLSGRHDRYVAGGERNITDQGLASCSAKLVPVGTVLLTTRAPIGYVAIAKVPIATNQGFRSLILHPGNVPEFLYYWLTANVLELERHSNGSTFKELSGSALKQIPIRLPGESEQRAIAHILGTLDDKIELNRRMNETLEEMARALFTSWFVNFDPVRAKAEGRDTGLPQEIADLFPDSFVDSELGEIPEGWGIKPIGDLADVMGGTTPSTKNSSYWDNGLHAWATPKDLSGLSVPILLDTERRITDAGLSQIGSGLLPIGTVLMSSRAPIGYLAIAEIPVAINQGFIAMKPIAEVSNLFLLFWARISHDLISSRANGSTFLEISKSSFRPISVVVPPLSVMNAFDGRARPLHERVVVNVRESITLRAFLDMLLPKLISGELRMEVG